VLGRLVVGLAVEALLHNLIYLIFLPMGPFIYVAF
jgi:hypothetical protein